MNGPRATLCFSAFVDYVEGKNLVSEMDNIRRRVSCYISIFSFKYLYFVCTFNFVIRVDYSRIYKRMVRLNNISSIHPFYAFITGFLFYHFTNTFYLLFKSMHIMGFSDFRYFFQICSKVVSELVMKLVFVIIDIDKNSRH